MCLAPPFVLINVKCNFVNCPHIRLIDKKLNIHYPNFISIWSVNTVKQTRRTMLAVASVFRMAKGHSHFDTQHELCFLFSIHLNPITLRLIYHHKNKHFGRLWIIHLMEWKRQGGSGWCEKNIEPPSMIYVTLWLLCTTLNGSRAPHRAHTITAMVPSCISKIYDGRLRSSQFYWTHSGNLTMHVIYVRRAFVSDSINATVTSPYRMHSRFENLLMGSSPRV